MIGIKESDAETEQKRAACALRLIAHLPARPPTDRTMSRRMSLLLGN